MDDLLKSEVHVELTKAIEKAVVKFHEDMRFGDEFYLGENAIALMASAALAALDCAVDCHNYYMNEHRDD